MKHRILTIVCMIGAGLAACVVLDKPAGVQAAISNPSYFKSLIIGGGITDADGGAQIEDNGNITTTGDLAVDDLTVGDDLSITGDLNVDGITTLDDTTVDGPFEVNGATTLDMPVNIYDATADPDALGAFVDLEEDSSKAQFIVNGQMGAIDDFTAPGDIALIGVLGPIGDAGTGEAPRIGFTNGTDSLDMALTTGGVDWDMPLGTDTTLTVKNTGAGAAKVASDEFSVSFPGINSTTDRIYIDDTGLNFYIGQGGFAPPINVPFLYNFARDLLGRLVINETESAASDTGGLVIGAISEELNVRLYGGLAIRQDEINFSVSDSGIWLYRDGVGGIEGTFNVDAASNVVTLAATDDLVIQANKSTGNSTVSVTNSNATHNANLSVDGFMILGTPAATTTIASDAITAKQTRIRLDTESSAASDDLTTINGGVDGALLILSTNNSSRDVVVKHLGSGGNIRLNGAVDYTIPNTSSRLTLLYNASQAIWAEISRSTN